MYKMYKPRNLMALAITMIVIALVAMFLSAYTVQQQRKRCKRCIELEYAIEQVIDVIREDQTDYWLDVLCETEEYCNLYDLLNEDCEIPDSTYRRLRTVFPDLPAKQAPQWK